MEERKNELGNIYGSRISRNGNWLNLLIVTHIDGKETYITCPVRINNTIDGKPYTAFSESGDVAAVMGIKVYAEKKSVEQKAEAAPVNDDDIPF